MDVKEDVNDSEMLLAGSEVVLASTGQRFGTMLIDIVGFLIFSLILGFTMGLLGLSELMLSVNEHLFGLMIYLIYFFPQEAMTGQTLGKLLLGTQVVNEDGSELTFGRAFGRTLCRLIPFDAFSFLGGEGHPKGWHDSIPKTKVISIKNQGVRVLEG